MTGRVTLGGEGLPGASVFSPVNRMDVFDPEGVYTFATAWFGDASATVTHRAWGIQFNDNWTRPQAYWYAARDVAVTAGATTAGQDLAVSQLATGHVTGVADGVSAPVTLGQTGVSLVIPPRPVGTAPANGTNPVGYATSFTWTNASAGGTDGVQISCGNGMSYRILGGGKSATIPDLTAVGISPSMDSCTWHPLWFSPTVEQLVEGPAAVDALPLQRDAFGADRSFTFNPY